MTQSDLNMTLEEENLDQIIDEINATKAGTTQEEEENENMDTGYGGENKG